MKMEILISGLEPGVYSVKGAGHHLRPISDPVERHSGAVPRQDLHDHP